MELTDALPRIAYENSGKKQRYGESRSVGIRTAESIWLTVTKKNIRHEGEKIPLGILDVNLFFYSR